MSKVKKVKFVAVTISMMPSAVTQLRGLVVHGTLGRETWKVTATRSGMGCNGGFIWRTREAAEKYARGIEKLLDWRRCPRDPNKAIAWALRVNKKHNAAMTRAGNAAARLDAKLMAGWVES
jgi:hypothetical protein